MGMENRLPDSVGDEDDQALRLTGRQMEILSLLKAGKANKEIAYELGIGVGTVKQHVVALFRKLKVTNRAMAISRGLDLAAAERGAGGIPAAAVGEGDIELRPACVLSLGPGGADMGRVRQVQAAVMTALGGIDATMVTSGRGVDVILGLNRAHEDDTARALRLAHDVDAALTQADSGWRLRGGLCSGALAASVNRHGGWTGETVAGRTIGRARALQAECAAGELLVDANAARMLAFSRRLESPEDDAPQVLTLGQARRRGRPPGRRPAALALLEREAELDRLRGHLHTLRDGRGAVVGVLGEAGMGKTALGRAFAAACREAGVTVKEGRCSTVPGEADITALAAAAGRSRQPLALLIDDGHVATPADAQALAALAPLTRERPLLVVAAGRRGLFEALRGLPLDDEIRLGRLSPAAMAMLIEHHGGTLPAPVAAAISELAKGVPLFAVELARAARHAGTGHEEELPIPLTLLTLVTARCDSFGLDRVLLRAVLRRERMAPAELRTVWPGGEESLRQALAHAVRAGIMVEDADGLVNFAHPMIRVVLQRTLLVESGLPLGAGVGDAGGFDG